MPALNLRTVAVVLAAGLGLGGCTTYSPFGYGSGVSVSYGDRYYDPYYDRYSPYGSRYGYGYAPYGWYDGYYYPGAGYYVYDRYRNPYYWTDGQRRYWTVRQKDPSVREVWTDFARKHATPSGTAEVESGSTTRTIERIRTNRAERTDRRMSRPVVDRIRTSRIERQSESSAPSSEPVSRRSANRQRPVAQPD